MKKAFLQLHAAVFLAGFTAILGKLILLNEGLLVWYRLLLTVMILGGIMAFKKELRTVPFADVLKISGVGLVITVHWVCFYGSIKYANASVAAHPSDKGMRMIADRIWNVIAPLSYNYKEAAISKGR